MKTCYEAMVLSCIDPRCQPKINYLMKKRKMSGKYSFFQSQAQRLVLHQKILKVGKMYFGKTFQSLLKFTILKN